jgi:hypothetical protein
MPLIPNDFQTISSRSAFVAAQSTPPGSHASDMLCTLFQALEPQDADCCCSLTGDELV